jgi:hypothetical protein
VGHARASLSWRLAGATWARCESVQREGPGLYPATAYCSSTDRARNRGRGRGFLLHMSAREALEGFWKKCAARKMNDHHRSIEARGLDALNQLRSGTGNQSTVSLENPAEGSSALFRIQEVCGSRSKRLKRSLRPGPTGGWPDGYSIAPYSLWVSHTKYG